jgi:predicted dehydrogenase
MGAGARGRAYAEFALSHPDRAKIVGVAEPNEAIRQHLMSGHAIADDRLFSDWKQLVDKPRLADAVIISVQDALHRDCAIAMAEKGYAILLEKPMAVTAEDCKAIFSAVHKNKVIFAVCHVLRYTRYTQMLKQILDSGAIGEIVSMDHLESIAHWHFAHSYVRGNWRNEKLSSPMLLAKSCHDLDWIYYMMGQRPCTCLSSFGGLHYFRPECRPAGAARRCLDCSIEASCAYSAKRIYFDRFNSGRKDWPVNVVALNPTKDNLTAALRTGPYGRCVWFCDNDVADHQVVNFEFEGGKTATFTATAFTGTRDRLTRIHGTQGEIFGDGNKIERFDFLTGKNKTVATDIQSDGSILSGHGGGDTGIMDAFVRAVSEGDDKYILSGPKESLESHLMVFAAEKARLENKVIEFNAFR